MRVLRCVVGWSFLLGSVQLAAQEGGARIGFALEAHAASSSGGARVFLPDEGAPVELSQAALPGMALRADADLGRWRLELALAHAPGTASAAFQGVETSLTAFRVSCWELRARLGFRLFGSANGAAGLILAGPTAQFWSVDGEEARTTVAASGAFALEAPLSPRLRLVTRGSVTAGPSFLAGDGFEGAAETTGVTRWEAGVGVRWLPWD
ncbi:MAG: hypothetical protein ACREMH_02605 [Gemmatimonadales bacterium]